MRKMLLAMLLVPISVFASNGFWFERVDAELSKAQGVSNTSYRPGAFTDSHFTFEKNGKQISVWARFNRGNDAVYGFDSDAGTRSAVVTNGNHLEIREGETMDLMQALHRRGNMAATKLKRKIHISADKTQVELKSSVQNSQGALTIVKMKKVNGYVLDIFLDISVSGVDSQAELDGVLSTMRPIIERQIEF